ncbi:MAG: cytochrome c [Phaeovulum sp.]|uniref:c-type cytochrome n=1 Tax=Phaeovulum sp. TaxID=2934796 RepID=UPI0027321697|nr:cytochrome c [Phaeovulum sp.]MDP2063871.1 cytochrome c [Phaeovulum sp.]
MVEGKWRVVAALAAALAVAGAVSLWWLGRAPKDPEKLFRKRCTSCHVLPNLSAFRRGDIRAIVTTMLVKNGANAVISPAEAERIIAYLEEVTPP